MAWTSPYTFSSGELVTAALMNDMTGNDAALRAGGIAIASQAALDFLYASSSTQFARLAKGAGYTVPRMNSGASAYEFSKPWVPRVTTVASASSITPSWDTEDIYDVSALAAGLTINNFTGTTSGENMMIRIKDNGTARALAYGGSFSGAFIPLPTTTVISKRLYMLFHHHAGIAFYLIAILQEA